MNYERIFNMPDSIIPPFYNVGLVEAHENAVTRIVGEHVTTAFSKVIDMYTALLPDSRDSEYGFAILNVLTTMIAGVTSAKGKLASVGNQYFGQHKAQLLAIGNITATLRDLLAKNTMRYIPPAGVFISVQPAVHSLECAACMRRTLVRCKKCRRVYVCSRDCLIKSGHRKKNCIPFDQTTQADVSGFAF